MARISDLDTQNETTATRRLGNVVDNLVETLRERIVSGEIPPGIRISQQHLAEELEVSRTPLREAMQRLATEGFLVSRANRGMVVAPVSLSDVDEAYALRVLVEPATIAAIAETVPTDEAVTLMREALVEMEQPGISTRAFQDAHQRYHQVLLNHYPGYARDLIGRLHTRIYRQQRLYFSRPPAIGEFVALDRIFLDAIESRQGEVARHVLEFHLFDAALGLVLEVEPDYAFDALHISLRGIGIDVAGLDGDSPRLPLQLSWRNGVPDGFPSELRTTNLHYLASD
ncbi:MAG: GntR family transcriptional regulator [Marmoricola sp.]